jgi:hypothetical protein
MTPAIPNPPHSRRAYDHRLRERVVRCGTSAVSKHVQIPRSTVSTWRPRGLRPVVTTEPVGHDLQQALGRRRIEGGKSGPRTPSFLRATARWAP